MFSCLFNDDNDYANDHNDDDHANESSSTLLLTQLIYIYENPQQFSS